MAWVSSGGQQSRLTEHSYLPAVPLKVPKASSTYCRYVQEAPFLALRGIVGDAREPDRHIMLPRYRERHQVGTTNRWRLPEALYSDLLGNAQALKAIDMPYNATLIRIITAESPRLSTNLDVSVPYSFRRSCDRPMTTPCVTLPPRQPVSRLRVLQKTAPQVSVRATSLSPLDDGAEKASGSLPARLSGPKDIFLYHTRKSRSFAGPDVLLNCLEMDWELYGPFLQKAEFLSRVLQEADDSPVPNSAVQSEAPDTIEAYISQSNSEGEERQMTAGTGTAAAHPSANKRTNAVDRTTHKSKRGKGNMTYLTLDVDDSMVTRRAMAIALGNLYHGDLEVGEEDVPAVLAACAAIGFWQLAERCTDVMLSSIKRSNVCRYHLAAAKYEKDHVVQACERWLELNLIPKLSTHIHLREMNINLLQKILKSNRLFVYSEYSVYRTLAFWLFLQLNPEIQLMPSGSIVTSFFNSLPKTCSFLETDEGHMFLPVFKTLRLHGVSDANDIEDMKIMNIVPENWLLAALSEHYHAMQRGGDMTALKEFHTSAVRHGFIIDDVPHYHSEVVSLHGFHFQLKALVEDASSNTYTVSLERLKPGDPMLSFRQCERHTFSMRAEREARYSLTVQHAQDADRQSRALTTGMLSHKFGLGDKTCRSQALTFCGLKRPMYVSLALLFPPS